MPRTKQHESSMVPGNEARGTMIGRCWGGLGRGRTAEVERRAKKELGNHGRISHQDLLRAINRRGDRTDRIRRGVYR